MGRGKGTKGQWDTLKQEWCSWALVMPRQRLQRLFVGSRTVHDDRQRNGTLTPHGRAPGAIDGAQ
jgi:hypothetical protein